MERIAFVLVATPPLAFEVRDDPFNRVPPEMSLLVVIFRPEQLSFPNGANHQHEDENPDDNDAGGEHGAGGLEGCTVKGFS